MGVHGSRLAAQTALGRDDNFWFHAKAPSEQRREGSFPLGAIAGNGPPPSALRATPPKKWGEMKDERHCLGAFALVLAAWRETFLLQVAPWVFMGPGSRPKRALAGMTKLGFHAKAAKVCLLRGMAGNGQPPSALRATPPKR
ncbi:MAG TPA: hypothetical protein DCL54_17820 [Alphaproteobacteria bacterium]|nr:hypothetical protein [Alphaproteobacteria bacterium]